ncbi:aplysianin A precursor [Aplysia californica]|uniref:Aplysianin A n=1 Tax=Aplysia californica TaxID=6500 RepID=Q8I6R3_APLCA|nr:aplysianin A precursor [Aplysia californica]AAN78211.1 aplysianin A precursor [Aplysia californica]
MAVRFLALGLLIFVTVCSGRRVCDSQQSCDAEQCDKNLDIAIVGAGPSGAYSAYKMRYSGKDVGVFEYSDRVGGRLYTYQLPNTPDVNLEIGGMRYITGAHNILQALTKELGLESVPFTEGFGRPGRTRFFLRGQSLTYDEVKFGDVPYNLTTVEKRNQGRIYEYYLKELTGFDIGNGSISREQLLKLRVSDGRPLYQLTFDEALDLVASSEGKEFARDVHVFTSEVTSDANALSVFDDHLGEDGVGDNILTVKNGMQKVPKELIKKFRKTSTLNQVQLNMGLQALRSKSDNSFVLYFRPTETIEGKTTVLEYRELERVCARQVILALPVYALRRLDWPPLLEDRAETAYAAVRNMAASKVFMTFDQAWWLDSDFTNSSAYVTKGDTPFSQMYDWKKSNVSGDFILIASYADGNNTLYQRVLRDHGQPINGSEPGSHIVSEPLKEYILHHLSEAYGVDRSAIPEPKTAVSQFWTDYPFGSGWITWRAGYHFDDVMNTMRRPSLKDEVYVVGADYAWGLMSSWIEGSLETTDAVLKEYFKAECRDFPNNNHLGSHMA